MYLVDLDDTPGYTLTIVQREEETETDKQEESGADSMVEPEQPAKMDLGDKAAQAEAIIANARAQLDALAAGVNASVSTTNLNAVGGLLMAGAVTTGGAATIVGPDQQKTDEETGPNGIADAGGAMSGDAGGKDGGDGGGGDET